MNPIQNASMMLKLQDSIHQLRQMAHDHAQRLQDLNEENMRLAEENKSVRGEYERIKSELIDWSKGCVSNGIDCTCVPHRILRLPIHVEDLRS